MRVAMIGLRAPRPGLGGIESVVAAVGPRLAQRGIEVTAFCRARYLGEGPGPPGVEEIPLPAVHTKHLETLTYGALATLMARRFDVIHLHAHGPALLSFIPHLRRQPLVVTLHALDYDRPKWGPVARAALRLGEAAALAYADGLTVVSQELLRRCQGRCRGELVFTPNGVDPVAPTPPASAVEALGVEAGGYGLFLGRLVEDKGCHHLIRAWRQVRGDVPLLLVGPPADPAYAARLAEEARGDPRVRIPGAVTGALKDALVAHAAIFALPSRVEGLSLALLEGMAAGRCIVASDIPANRDVAEGCAALFPWGDEAALAAQIQALLDDPQRRDALGQAARRRALNDYTWDRSADALSALYSAVARR